MQNWKKALIACVVSLVTSQILDGVLTGFLHGWVSCMAFYITFDFLEYAHEEKK